jgi:hypothetical protein
VLAIAAQIYIEYSTIRCWICLERDMYFPAQPNRGEGYILWQGADAARLIFRLPDMDSATSIDLKEPGFILRAARASRMVAVLVSRTCNGTVRVSLSGSNNALSFEIPEPTRQNPGGQQDQGRRARQFLEGLDASVFARIH